ncbi:hypothetical protein [Acinetobacter variabilis]|uniref:Signal pepetide n=1 Tax=Acinetobacter variabilis TaxID=70346 RepID=N8VIQ2_9GAMM|nr:hypothetical protein [Acinetobacter variabilis]ENU99435.1 hypothetical protein F969_01617 [Acinetobacter variabilis]
MTDSTFLLKLSIAVAMVLLLAISLWLWSQTPELFEYFNQAFCAH